MSKLKFVISEETEAYYIYLACSSANGQEFTRLTESFLLDQELANRLRKAKRFDEVRQELLARVASDYETVFPFIEKTLIYYQESWDEINDAFFERVEAITERSWKYQTYDCVLSNYHQGISNWGTSNIIVRSWKENPFTQRRITAHELIISHYFNYFNSKHPNEPLSSQEIWQLAEIAAWAITGLDDEMKKLWPWDKSGYYTNHNYPHLVKLQLALKGPFVNRKSFDEYVKIGSEKVKGLSSHD